MPNINYDTLSNYLVGVDLVSGFTWFIWFLLFYRDDPVVSVMMGIYTGFSFLFDLIRIHLISIPDSRSQIQLFHLCYIIFRIALMFYLLILLCMCLTISHIVQSYSTIYPFVVTCMILTGIGIYQIIWFHKFFLRSMDVIHIHLPSPPPVVVVTEDPPEIKTARNSREYDKCSICLRSINAVFVQEELNKVPVTKLSCAHSFHDFCIQNWAKTCEENRRDKVCPICRKPFAITTTLPAL